MNPFPFSQFNNSLAPFYALGIIRRASGVIGGENPEYTAEDFFEFYPQFLNLEIPTVVLDQFILMAQHTVIERQWHENWKYGMDLFIAHFLTLYLQSVASGSNSNAGQVIGAAQTKGLLANKSVGDVSVGYDFADIMKDLDGWAQWKLTQYGVQFASFARILGKAGMMIW